ncbi:unnamed protein product [Discosporangium mesarthrocarpum]
MTHEPLGNVRHIEGKAVLELSPGLFFSKHQLLQRDLSVAVLRSFRIARDTGGLPGATDMRPRGENVPLLRVCDALSGTGVRAIRYALEAGPVRVLANDIDARAVRGWRLKDGSNVPLLCFVSSLFPVVSSASNDTSSCLGQTSDSISPITNIM